MSLRAMALILSWGGVAVMLATLVWRFTRGAWSLEDDDIPAISMIQKVLVALSLAASALGLGLFVWDWHGVG